jgi:hypothetical protein
MSSNNNEQVQWYTTSKARLAINTIIIIIIIDTDALQNVKCIYSKKGEELQTTDFPFTNKSTAPTRSHSVIDSSGQPTLAGKVHLEAV